MGQLESMFGSPPEMVDLQIDRENQQWASRPGDAYQRMASAGSLAAQRGGSALGNALGVVDPRKEMANKVQEALKEIKDSGVDLNQDPVEFYTTMSKAFASRGLMEQATQASMKAMELKDKSAERADKESSRQNRLAIENVKLAEEQAKLKIAMAKAQGKPEASALMELIKDNYKDASVESVTAAYDVLNNGGSLMEAQKKLQTKRENEKMIGTTPEKIPVFRKEGEATYIVQNGQKIPYEGPVQPTGGVNLDMRTDQAEVNNQSEEFKAGLKGHTERMQEARSVERPLAVMRKILDSKKLTTGSAADTRTEIARLGATLGFTLDPKVTDNDDLFDAMVTAVLLPKMKMLGGNDSEQELKVIRESTGSRKFTVATLSRILEVAENAGQRAKSDHENYRKHRSSGGKTTDWDWGTYSSFANPKSPAASPQEQPKQLPSKPPVNWNTKAKDYLRSATGKEPTDKQIEEWLNRYKPQGK